MQTSNDLTRRQREVLVYLRDRDAVTDVAPTLDELCEALGLRSRGSLHKHVMALAEAGFIEPMNRKQRGVRLIADQPLATMAYDESTNAIPLYGTIAAGRPIEALESPETVEVPPSLRSNKPCYVLRVRGDSMMDEGILDGDFVVVEHREQAQNGEIVVALIEGTEATLKRIIQRPDEIVLCPSNAQMGAMRYRPEQVAIQGVVVGQMRRY
ncbi:MAG: transcriptional repressor LexA [Chromatiales bacterium]|jgi:repressor LexA|nr:transcriptional repressor LexA [Chromatiales bacterium]